MAANVKLVYSFGDSKTEGRSDMKDLLGGKGAALAGMCRSGAPVPPGFTITTDACRSYYFSSDAALFKAVPRLRPQFDQALKALEDASGRRLGDPKSPLLVSVRSGAKFSMPGMMDTILNLGLNDECVEGLAALTGDRRFALDSYRRFIQMFSDVVKGTGKERFEEILEAEVHRVSVHSDRELNEESLERVVERYKDAYRVMVKDEFPQDPRGQLIAAVEAVFRSWKNPRAFAYRKANNISDKLGTACNVQKMVFGNMGEESGTGVGFTRDPGTGEKIFYGEYLPNAQGEDVVAGIRTPLPISKLAETHPKANRELILITKRLEKQYRDAQDFEFTVEKGTLYVLQTRVAKRTALAALRTAVDMVKEKLITKDEALLRVKPEALDQLLKPVFDEQARKGHHVLAKGLPAGPGAASGRIFFTAEAAEEAAARGPVLLVRNETNPDDIKGMMAAEGILTATGGLTSHAAVVGRGMGKVCVVGCGAVSLRDGTVSISGKSFSEGDYLSLDGFTGEVIEDEVKTCPSEVLRVLLGELPPQSSQTYRYYSELMKWADDARRLGVRANADRPEEARIARALGAEGIGLARTEHMFFGDARIPQVLAMIVAQSPQERRKALDALYPMQKDDFKVILKAMHDLPVTIRTLDPPLHEFLPHDNEEAEKRARAAGLDPKVVWDASRRLKEINPMLGHRGCRLGITHPEITEMQGRAILAAAEELRKEGVKTYPEIMIPLVGTAAELRNQEALIRDAAETATGKRKGAFKVGTMIEVPRAALVAGEIAETAEFFSFGTNDLTQMLFGFSRDDYGKFIDAYLEKEILPRDPFQTLDREGVGRMVRFSVDAARKKDPKFKLGVCGEHGGDPDSIEFFHEVGLDYVSCSTYRVPAARLAAAQAAVKEKLARKMK
ncbi:MAG: pyruvate, phosphate dikinase, partial [Elusimicrobia bacterium CG_4_10_14_0_2_um_filter_63_34]